MDESDVTMLQVFGATHTHTHTFQELSALIFGKHFKLEVWLEENYENHDNILQVKLRKQFYSCLQPSTCFASAYLKLKPLPQVSQVNLYSPVWTDLWFSNDSFTANVLLQIRHSYFIPSWALMWFLKLVSLLNPFLQILQ